MGKRTIMSGNVAVAEAAVRAGCKIFAGYPITPQTTITEYMSKRMSEVGGEFIQAESEVAAVNMLIGGSGVGARVMTATSCQGLSLMAEGMSSMAAGMYPGVIVDVQRGGPGTSNIFASQCDYNFVTKSLGHGGLHAYVLGPSTAQEAAELTYSAFDFADQERTPVVVLTDGMIGQMMEAVTLPEFKETLPEKDWAITGRAGMRPRKLTSDSVKPATELEKRYKTFYDRYLRWERENVLVEELYLKDAELVIAAWGSVARIAKSAIKALRAEGHKVGLIRPITLYPFPVMSFRGLDAGKVKNILSIELSMPPQMYYDVDHAVQGKIPLHCYTRSGGVMITAEEIKDAAQKLL